MLETTAVKTLLDREGRAVKNGALVFTRIAPPPSAPKSTQWHWEPCLCFYLPLPFTGNPASARVCWLDSRGRAQEWLTYFSSSQHREYLWMPT